MDFTAINNFTRGGYLPTKKYSEVKRNHKYRITSMYEADTKYGIKVVIVLENEFQLFLPARISNALKSDSETYRKLMLFDPFKKEKIFITFLDNNEYGHSRAEFSTE